MSGNGGEPRTEAETQEEEAEKQRTSAEEIKEAVAQRGFWLPGD